MLYILGMSASVSDVRSKSDLVLRLPLSAITSLDGNPMVWKLDTATSTLHAAKIRPAALDGNGVIIEDGIQAGETVVTAGANLVREGQQVKVLQ